MSSTIARKTGSATLVIDNFSQLTSHRYKSISINGLSHIHFGIHPKTVVYSSENVSVFWISYGNAFKFKAKVSIINAQKKKLFTKEYAGEFKDFGGRFDESYSCLMPRTELLWRRNGYLHNDKLILLCEIELTQDEQENASIAKELNDLSENFQSLLKDDKFADATLIVGKDGKQFRVHKNILAARSPVFAAMFDHDCQEKRQNKVIIADMDEEVCAEMLSYIYTGIVKELDQLAMELLVAADKYQLPSLKFICSEYMCNHLAVSSVANVLVLADLHQATELKSKCFEYIADNVDQVESTDGWKLIDAMGKLLKEFVIYLAKKK